MYINIPLPKDIQDANRLYVKYVSYNTSDEYSYTFYNDKKAVACRSINIYSKTKNLLRPNSTGWVNYY